MKKKFLLPVMLLAAMTLVGCGGGKSSETSTSTSSSTSQSSSETIQYGVAIANKEAVGAKWFLGDANRSLDINLTPEANPLTEIGNGSLVITSSNTEAVKVQGLELAAVAEGKATITVTYHEKVDTVDVEVLEQSAITKYGAEHKGNLADPLSNEDALLVAKHADYAQETYYVKGEIASFYHAPGARTDGAVSWFLKPAKDGGEQFEIYKCYKEDGSFLTDDDVWVGGTAVAHGSFTSYNTQYETSAAVFDSCEGNKPAPRQTIEATFAQALAAASGTAIADGADTYDYYKFTAFVSKQEGKNYFLTATKGEALTTAKYTKSDETQVDYYDNAIEIYNAADAVAAKLLKNAQVEVTMILKNYHGQAENLLALAEADVTVLEAGTPWVIPEHDATVAEALTIINGLADGATTEDLYNLKEVYVKEVTGAYNAEYGNMSFTVADTADGTDTLTVFRAKTDADTAAKVVAGAQVTVKGNLQKYVKNETMTPELLNVESITVKASIPEGAVTATFSAQDMIADPTAEYTGGSVKFSTKDVDSVLTVAATGTDANTGKIYKSNDHGFQIRLYKTGEAKFTATVKTGYEIVSAVANVEVNTSGWWDAPAETNMTIAADKLSASISAVDNHLALYSVTVVYIQVAA